MLRNEVSSATCDRGFAPTARLWGLANRPPHSLAHARGVGCIRAVCSSWQNGNPDRAAPRRVLAMPGFRLSVAQTQRLCAIAWDSPMEVSSAPPIIQLEFARHRMAQIDERSHQESEEKFAKAFRCSPQPFTLSTLKEDRYIEVNDAFELKTGYRHDEVIGRTVEELGIWVDYSERGKLVEKILRGESIRNVECHFRKKTGEVFIALLSAELIELAGEMCVVANAIDITDWRRTEEALRATEKKATLYLHQTMFGVIEWDRDFRVVEWNPAAESIFGYSRSETLGHHAYELIVTPRTIPEIKRVFESAINVTRGELSIHENTSKKGDALVCEWFNTPLTSEHGAVIGLVSLVHDITARRRTEEALTEMTRKLIQGQEQERVRIARELHDDIAQRLALLAIELERVQQCLPDSASEERALVGTLRNRTAEISTDVQAMSHELHSSRLEHLGIVVAMRSFCAELGDQQKVKIHFKSDDVPTRLSPEISLCLYRVLQEALHNAVKHSGVRSVDVQLRKEFGEIQLIVRDSGRGFDVTAAMQGGGLGLTSMQERVRLVNGTITIDSKPTSGTTIHVSVPLESGQSSQRNAMV